MPTSRSQGAALAPLLDHAACVLDWRLAASCTCALLRLQGFSAVRDYAARRTAGREHLRRALQLLSLAETAKVSTQPHCTAPIAGRSLH